MLKIKKKAAGRALGTFVEIITYYLLDSWGFADSIAIETPLKEFSNPEITHNVEFTMPPVLWQQQVSCAMEEMPITAKKLMSKVQLSLNAGDVLTKNQLVSSKFQIKNACKVCSSNREMFLASVQRKTAAKQLDIVFSKLLMNPYAMFECKRVGIEEGKSTGPQTIEKAKQGAYVARAVSALQRLRGCNGEIKGYLENNSQTPIVDDYYVLLEKIINNPAKKHLLKDFVLTVGVVSNHGNWFTAETMNKELKVLAQSYDWLLFLTDEGLSEFITDCLLSENYPKIQQAFRDSYPKTDNSRFTKTAISLDAHLALKQYFNNNAETIQGWFNLLAPQEKKIVDLQHQLETLQQKPWGEIYQ